MIKKYFLTINPGYDISYFNSYYLVTVVNTLMDFGSGLNLVLHIVHEDAAVPDPDMLQMFLLELFGSALKKGLCTVQFGISEPVEVEEDYVTRAVVYMQNPQVLDLNARLQCAKSILLSMDIGNIEARSYFVQHRTFLNVHWIQPVATFCNHDAWILVAEDLQQNIDEFLYLLYPDYQHIGNFAEACIGKTCRP